MELFYVEATMWNPRGVGRRKRVTLLVDRGATYTVLPAALLAELGVAPTRKVRLRLADNKVVERELGGGDRGGGPQRLRHAGGFRRRGRVPTGVCDDGADGIDPRPRAKKAEAHRGFAHVTRGVRRRFAVNPRRRDPRRGVRHLAVRPRSYLARIYRALQSHIFSQNSRFWK